jgi:hypothetical protein
MVQPRDGLAPWYYICRRNFIKSNVESIILLLCFVIVYCYVVGFFIMWTHHGQCKMNGHNWDSYPLHWNSSTCLGIHEGVCTLQWLYMDVTMAIFHVFLKYKKINKIRSIEIIKKGFTYLKLS